LKYFFIQNNLKKAQVEFFTTRAFYIYKDKIYLFFTYYFIDKTGSNCAQNWNQNE
jgi:hypothetical protein